MNRAPSARGKAVDMNPIKSYAIAMTIGLVAATFAVGGVTGTPGRPECRPDTTFENDEVRIWFHSLTGFVRVVDKNTSSGQGMYFYKSSAITELDADGEAVRSMNIERAFPGTSACTVEETGEFVNMTITFTGMVREVRGGPVGDATVTLAYHFNKSAYGAKFDLVVDDWPWAAGAEEHALAYDFHMTAGNLVLEPAENGVGVKDESGEKQGYVEWAENATATYEDGSEEELNVTASWTGNEHSLKLRLLFEDAPGGYVNLYYDPWMGIGDYVIVLGRLIGLAPVEQALPGAVGRVVRGAL